MFGTVLAASGCELQRRERTEDDSRWNRLQLSMIMMMVTIGNTKGRRIHEVGTGGLGCWEDENMRMAV